MDPIELGIDRTVVTRWTPDDTWPAMLDEYATSDDGAAPADGVRPGPHHAGGGGSAADHHPAPAAERDRLAA